MARRRTRIAGKLSDPVRTLHDVIPRTEWLLDAYAAGTREPGVAGTAVLVAADAVARVLSVRDEAAVGLGERVGHEWVDTRLVGKSLLSCIYVERFSAGLLVWRFVWYFNGNEWGVVQLDITADLSALVHLLPNPAGA